jgi:DNA-binding PadR family transcriptional regulator
MLNFDWAKRTHKGLRRWILFIVRDTPKSGAEIMDVMEANLQGWWRPSPGSVYPMLKSMVGEGVLERSEDNKYELTEKGREEIETPFPRIGKPVSSPRSVEGAMVEISSYISYLEDLSHSDPKLAEKSGELRELSRRLAKVADSE